MTHSPPLLRETRGGPRILLVDDDVATLDGLRRAVTFRFPELNIDVARSMTEAVARIRVADYAVILTDVRMPGGSGLELLQHIRRSCPGVAVLIMSGRLDPALASTARAQGAYAVLSKPFNRDVLSRTITQALRLRGATFSSRQGHGMAAETADWEANPVQSDPLSIERWILSALNEQQEHTLDSLGQRLPEMDAVLLFLAIDRLSRTGQITLWPLPHGNYRVARKYEDR